MKPIVYKLTFSTGLTHILEVSGMLIPDIARDVFLTAVEEAIYLGHVNGFRHPSIPDIEARVVSKAVFLDEVWYVHVGVLKSVMVDLRGIITQEVRRQLDAKKDDQR